VPDLPYFIHMTGHIRLGHTTRGIFAFDLPVGLLLLWLFHVLVKRPLVSLAPEYIRRRIDEKALQFRFGPWPRLLLIALSLLIGIVTHVLWDGLTHEHGLFVKHWEVLRERSVAEIHYANFRLLQLGFSVVGFATVAWALWEYWKKKPEATDSVPSRFAPGQRIRLVMVGAAIAVAFGIGMFFVAVRHHTFRWSLVELVIYTITCACAQLLVYSVWWRWSGQRWMGRDSSPAEAGSE